MVISGKTASSRTLLINFWCFSTHIILDQVSPYNLGSLGLGTIPPVGQAGRSRGLSKKVCRKYLKNTTMCAMSAVDFRTHTTTSRPCCLFSVKMPFCPKKGQIKGAKVGRAVGQNQLFCILLNIGSLDFFDILHDVRDH